MSGHSFGSGDKGPTTKTTLITPRLTEPRHSRLSLPKGFWGEGGGTARVDLLRASFSQFLT